MLKPYQEIMMALLHQDVEGTGLLHIDTETIYDCWEKSDVSGFDVEMADSMIIGTQT